MFNKVRSQKPEVRRSKEKFFFIYLVFIIYILPLTSYSQCAMCRAAVESEGNATKAEAINDGIVYLMIIPYLLVGAIGYAIFKMYKNKKRV
jgi:hypothetical protein